MTGATGSRRSLFLEDLLERPRFLPAAIAAAGFGALALALASQVWGGLDPCAAEVGNLASSFLVVVCTHER